MNYILSRGHYQHQATKDLAYSIFGSYLGDRYDIQFFLNTYNFVNQENGGITDDTYILNPEEVQGEDYKRDDYGRYHQPHGVGGEAVESVRGQGAQ